MLIPGGFLTTELSLAGVREQLLMLWPLDDGQLERLESPLKVSGPALDMLLLRKCHLSKRVCEMGRDGMEAMLPFGFMEMSPSHDNSPFPSLLSPLRTPLHQGQNAPFPVEQETQGQSYPL